jgi:hypothetical protein
MKNRMLMLVLLCTAQLSIFNFQFSTLYAQETYVERLQMHAEGQGTVRLHHDADIVALLLGKLRAPRANATTPTTRTHSDSVAVALHTDSLQLGHARKVRTTGYRVQVYAGGNSREAQRRAYQMEAQVRSLFPGHSVYTRFVAPRWICHVGDFRTREEALELLRSMRSTGRFPEAITVKCKINAHIYE